MPASRAGAAARPRHRVLAVLAAAAVLFVAPRPSGADQQAGLEAVVDADYAFRLDQPGPGWRLLDRQAMRTMIPDAAAGAASEHAWGAVLVEAWAGDDLAAYGRVVAAHRPVEDARVLRTVEIPFAGNRALLTEFVGRFHAIESRWLQVVLLRGGYAYQVAAWMTGAEAPYPDPLRAFLAAFHLLPGPARGRADTSPTPDAAGPGWMVRDGVFSSASYRLTVKPPEGWRAVVGDELQRMNSNAEVGLVRSNPDAYVVILAERAAGVERARHEAGLRTGVGETYDRLPDRDRSGRLAGVDVSLDAYRDRDAAAITLHHGVAFHDDLCLQVLGWTGDAALAKDGRWWDGPLGAVSFLDAAAAASLERALEGALPPVRAVGPGYGLRGLVYRDFDAGFTWRRPSPAWRVRVGQEARGVNPDASLFFENPSRGLLGLVIAEPVDADGRAYHEAVLRGVVGEGAPLPPATPVRLGDFDALTSTVRKDLGLPFEFRYVTAVREGKAVQLSVWGLEGNVRTSSAEIRAAVDGLRVPAGGVGPRVRRAGPSYVDERVGFALRAPGPEWRFREDTPRPLAQVGTIVSYSTGAREIAVVAVSGLPSTRGPDGIVGLVMDLVGSRLVGMQRAEVPAGESPTLSGKPCLHVRWKGAARTLDAYALLLDSTLVIFLAGGPPEGGEPGLDALRDGFTLLD